MSQATKLQLVKLVPQALRAELLPVVRQGMKRELGEALLEKLEPGQWYAVRLEEDEGPASFPDGTQCILRRVVVTVQEDRA